jgi:ABC-type branched-subunit amino acid transport system substrate-binding protein
MRGATVLVGAVLLAATGCGGPMQPQELARSVQTLESAAAEGALLAHDVARDRTKATFVRAHSRDLGETVDHEAEKLSDADAGGVVALRKSQAVDLADRISQALGTLQVSPGSRSEGATAERELRRTARRAAEISDSL